MSPISRKEYVQAIVERYKKVGRKEKRQILDEFCQICAYHRKHAIRKLSQAQRRAIELRIKNGWVFSTTNLSIDLA